MARPQSIVEWDDYSMLLKAYINDEVVFTWNYSVFEDYTGEALTPSMYSYMASYVENRISRSILFKIDNGTYSSGSLEEAAADSYWNMPILEKIELHKQELTNLKAELVRASTKQHAFTDAILEDVCPFSPDSPIYVDFFDWCRDQKLEWGEYRELIEKLIWEEESWRSGAERASLFDPMDE